MGMSYQHHFSTVIWVFGTVMFYFLLLLINSLWYFCVMTAKPALWAACIVRTAHWLQLDWDPQEQGDLQVIWNYQIQAFQVYFSFVHIMKVIYHQLLVIREAFANFDYNVVARMEEKDIEDIISNKELKLAECRVRAIIENAKCVQKASLTNHKKNSMDLWYCSSTYHGAWEIQFSGYQLENWW